MWTNGGKVPNWKGPVQDIGATGVNGDPFEKQSKVGHSHKLSGGAASFKPTPIEFLNRGSTADNDQPVIVSSSSSYTSPDTNAKREKGKGRATQEPIGTRGLNTSPNGGFVSFTSDAAEGGHYVKLVNMPSKNMLDTLRKLYQDVSRSHP